MTKSQKSLFYLIIFVNVIFLPEYSFAADRSMWNKRQKNLHDAGSVQIPTKQTFQIVDPLKIKILEEYGSIIDSHRGTNGKLIIHIQDAHANYEGQMSLANILEALIKDYALNLILVEGGSTDSDFTYLRDRASLEEKKEKADKLLKDGIISGEEYLNIASDYPMSFQGIEDREVYDSHVEAMWEIDKIKEPGIAYLDKMISASNVVKSRIYNSDLSQLDKTRKEYKTGSENTMAYYEFLYNKAKDKKISLENFPNFTNLIKASQIEKKIDLEKIKEGNATKEEVMLFKEYVEISSKININKLFKEEALVEDYLKETLATNSDQKALIKIAKAMDIMTDLINLKVVPEEYEYFLAHRENFNPVMWSDFLTQKINQYSLSAELPLNHPIISNNLQDIEKFYSLAEERDSVFIKKTEERMNKDNAKVAALIAGGFHTPRLIRSLAERGYSYIVISPKITEETDESFYRSTLRRQWLPE